VVLSQPGAGLPNGQTKRVLSPPEKTGAPRRDNLIYKIRYFKESEKLVII
jgi:hypothetical protein